MTCFHTILKPLIQKERRLLCEKLRTDFLDVLNKLQETQRNAKYMIKTHPLQRKLVSNVSFEIRVLY